MHCWLLNIRYLSFRTRRSMEPKSRSKPWKPKFHQTIKRKVHYTPLPWALEVSLYSIKTKYILTCLKIFSSSANVRRRWNLLQNPAAICWFNFPPAPTSAAFHPWPVIKLHRIHNEHIQLQSYKLYFSLSPRAICCKEVMLPQATFFLQSFLPAKLDVGIFKPFMYS